jgi:hypothetical protein
MHRFKLCPMSPSFSAPPPLPACSYALSADQAYYYPSDRTDCFRRCYAAYDAGADSLPPGVGDLRGQINAFGATGVNVRCWPNSSATTGAGHAGQISAMSSMP